MIEWRLTDVSSRRGEDAGLPYRSSRFQIDCTGAGEGDGENKLVPTQTGVINAQPGHAVYEHMRFERCVTCLDRMYLFKKDSLQSEAEGEPYLTSARFRVSYMTGGREETRTLVVTSSQLSFLHDRLHLDPPNPLQIFRSALSQDQTFGSQLQATASLCSEHLKVRSELTISYIPYL